MLNQKVLDELLKPNLIEKQQLKLNSFQKDMPKAAYEPEVTTVVPVLNQYFFRNREIYISKHNRFAPYPTHEHEFLEMNYMLRGEADEIVNNQPVHLNTGDLLIINVGTSHSINYLDSNDLMMNILFRDKDINLNLIGQLRSSNSVFYQFLLDRKLGTRNDSPFLLFDDRQSPDITNTMDSIINEYYLNNDYSDVLISNLINVLIIELVRNYSGSNNRNLNKSQRIVAQVLKDITNDPAHIRLDDEAKKLNYNRNYLSNLFKQIVGHTFSEMLAKQRMIDAEHLIKSTSLPLKDIMNRVGIHNRTYFVKKYKAEFGSLPSADRKSASSIPLDNQSS